MKIPEKQNTINNLINQYHTDNQEPPRPHLGCSQLGHSCDRWLWLSFRWAVVQKFEGRLLRLFRRGHMEEVTIVRDLRAIGIDIRGVTGNQSRVDFGNHVSGSMDGIIHSGVPEAPEKKHLAEFKTASDKKFKEMVAKGLEEANHTYWVQVHVYMKGAELDRAIFLMVNKNDDSIYTERVKYDEAIATKAIERGHRITSAERMPEPLSADPSWYECKWCAAHEFCHSTHTTKENNCRTCSHVTPTQESEWHCAIHNGAVPVEFQRNGCDDHILHPDLVPYQMKESEIDNTVYWLIDGVDVLNGNPSKCDGWRSSEIIARPDICTQYDEDIGNLRNAFDARLVE